MLIRRTKHFNRSKNGGNVLSM